MCMGLWCGMAYVVCMRGCGVAWHMWCVWGVVCRVHTLIPGSLQQDRIVNIPVMSGHLGSNQSVTWGSGETAVPQAPGWVYTGTSDSDTKT